MSHDLEIANLETFANADGLNPIQRALLKQAAQRLEWCDETIFKAEQRNRELTRQVERLRDLLNRMGGFLDGMYRKPPPIVIKLLSEWEALTAPPSSSDPGRADTGREER